MRSHRHHHRTLRATAAVCAALALAGPAPAAFAAAPAAPPRSAAAAAPDPFEGLTAAQIADRAVIATRAADSLRMTGRIVTDGQTLRVDFSVDSRGSCKGLIQVGGGTAELRRLDGIVYMKGDSAFWRSSMASQGVPEAQIAPTVELVRGRWIKIAPGQAGSDDLSGVCDIGSLLTGLDRDRAARRGLTRGPDDEIAGTPVATLVAHRPGAVTTTLSVAAEGTPYLLRIVRTGGSEPGSLALSDFGRPVKVTAPPADQTLDLSRLDDTGTGTAA
ncbi:hypothetical protein [Streptomyces termitum]|uniref:hypothetical protein n=1 Tax=Streptomyces termitum TaxID=67368 RepID=UPI0037881561